MRKLSVLLFIAMLFVAQPVYASPVGKFFNGIGNGVNIVLKVGHEILHIVEIVIDGGMKVLHTGLDIVKIPFEDSTS